MTMKSGGRILTDEQWHFAVLKTLDLEEKKTTRVLGIEFEKGKIDFLAMLDTTPEQEAVVMKSAGTGGSGSQSLSKAEWTTMEAAMPPEERATHKSLSEWMKDRAKAVGVSESKEEDGEDEEMDAELKAMLEAGGAGEGGGEGGDDSSDDEPDDPKKPAKKEEEEEEEKEKKDKGKNWSAVNVAYKEAKLNYRGSFTTLGFTNWLWCRCVRPKLAETKSPLPEVEMIDAFLIDDIEEILGEFMPVIKEDKKDKKEDKDKKDKKDKKDDKDKKEDKKDKKAEKEDKKKDEKKGKDDKKKKKEKVSLNNTEKVQAKNLIANMIYGEGGKNKTVVEGWVNKIATPEIDVKVPWEFQVGHVLRNLMAIEKKAKKEKENPDLASFYEAAQNVADAICMLRKQYKFEFPDVPEEHLLPLQDALAVQERFKQGSVGSLKFDLLWYLQHGAHLISGSSFMKKHRSTVFKPFNIQESMVDGILQPGPQLIFGIAPPGTGKTAVVAHLLSLFPAHTLVFTCAALPVVLAVGRICNQLGLPVAFVKGRRITPSWTCGRGLGHHQDMPKDEWWFPTGQTAVNSLKYAVVKENLQRKQRRLAEKKRLRNLHNLKRNPRIYLMCDVSSAGWLLRQMEPNRTILVIDEPPMGSDQFPKDPEDSPLACAMIQAMMTPMYKTIWMSATLPRMNALPTLVKCFMDRFRLPMEKKEQHVRECFSTELDRGALMCGPSGHVAFPHSRVRTAKDLQKLCTRLPSDPLVLKAYTERALASLLERWAAIKKEGHKALEHFSKTVIHPDVKFADLSELSHATIRGYAMEVLEAAASTDDDSFVEAFCISNDSAPNVFPPFNLAEMIFGNAYAFPGLTLVADDDPAGQLMKMAEKLIEHMPKASDLEEDLKAQEAAGKKREKDQAAAKKQDRNGDGGDDDEGSQTRLKFSSDLVIQSENFLKRWCPNRPKNSPTIARLLPSVRDFQEIKKLPVDERWQMLALSGAASFDPKLDVDRSNPEYTHWVHESMTNNKLACVTAGKEFTWGANVPASTVVVTKTFAETTSVAGMLQYVGRAARRGLTTHGQAIFERDEDLDRIFASPDGLSTEALTMERYAEWWLTQGAKW